MENGCGEYGNGGVLSCVGGEGGGLLFVEVERWSENVSSSLHCHLWKHSGIVGADFE